ncbi:hypothetical protein FTO68_02520 [Methanocalculus taiwanensis]|uniref:Uncharacterized protein n=1 Tax=Methanocalculus taiwanensis TaxID=106207 RepID=A0ABD4TK13_9EURY|nr:hypothetical protein [Methanocalculus taiwanensis]MCQ1537862.1 hypothetical protein [Methanocalculus taiwanensis]
MSQSGSQQDLYSREYGRSGTVLSYRGSGKPDIYNREYRRSGTVLSHRASGKPDIYSREYGQSGTVLSHRASGKPDIYNREYIRAQASGKPTPHVAYPKVKEMPAIKTALPESVVEKKESPAQTEPQPSIFEKISQFLHGVIGSK